MTDEAAVMLRIGIFGVVAAVAYWLLTYEWLGSFALLTLGLGPAFAGLVMARMQRRGPEDGFWDFLRRLAGAPRERRSDEQPAVEAMIIPAPTIWPFVLSVGFAIALTGLVFGLWLVLLGVIFVVAGFGGWLASVYREYAASRLVTGGIADEPAGQEGSRHP